MRYFKNKKISLAVQKHNLKITYPKLIDKIFIKKGILHCYMRLQPSPNSDIYEIHIRYKINERPKVWVIYPKIEKLNGEYPIHKYGFDTSGNIELCVFCPEYKEWNDKNMLLSETFIPWVVTWLHTYEFWLVTGIWNYKEKHPKLKKRKK